MSKLELIHESAAQRTVVVITGTGGPAELAMGGVLKALGCDAPASARNGTSRITEFNGEVLESAGTSINSWTTFNTRWLDSPKATEFLRRALDLLGAEFGGSYLALMQDASTARLLPFWNMVFDRAGVLPRYLFVVSDPADIAEDLHEHFEIGYRTGHLIWLRAALEAEANSRGRLRTFVHSAQVGGNPAGTANQAAKSLKLVLPRDVQTTFASKNFRLRQTGALVDRGGPLTTGEVPAPATSDWVTATHDILKDWASNGESAEAQTILDAIRETFDEAVPAFLGVEASNPANIRFSDLDPKLESDREAAQVELEKLRRANEERSQALEDAQEELRARYSEIVTLTRMLATETSSARRFERSATRLGGIAQALERGAARGRVGRWLGWILPWRWHIKRIKRHIEREGFFDSSTYLAANPDVASAGADPLRHYLSHGANEGRPLGIE